MSLRQAPVTVPSHQPTQPQHNIQPTQARMPQCQMHRDIAHHWELGGGRVHHTGTPFNLKLSRPRTRLCHATWRRRGFSPQLDFASGQSRPSASELAVPSVPRLSQRSVFQESIFSAYSAPWNDLPVVWISLGEGERGNLKTCRHAGAERSGGLGAQAALPEPDSELDLRMRRSAPVLACAEPGPGPPG